MTTLKLKQPANPTEPTPRDKPVRQRSPSLRDRSAPPPVKTRPAKASVAHGQGNAVASEPGKAPAATRGSSAPARGESRTDRGSQSPRQGGRDAQARRTAGRSRADGGLRNEASREHAPSRHTQRDPSDREQSNRASSSRERDHRGPSASAPARHTQGRDQRDRTQQDRTQQNRDQPGRNQRPAPRQDRLVDRPVRQASAQVQPAASVVDSTSELPRLSKVMAERGICSRREADDWIINGWVKVNGEIVETLGTRIDPQAEIIVSTYAKEHQAESVTVLLHKPVGYVSGQAEDGYAPAVVLFQPENQWAEDPSGTHFKRGHLRGLAPAGRLDIDSTGLLVLTQDGRIARKLIGDDSLIEKEYLVRVEGQLTAQGLALLNHGLSLDGVTLKPAKVSWQNEDQLRFVLREGRKRQIRRMCELVGLQVVGLKRIRIGSISLGKLPAGQWRYLAANERF